MDVTTAYIELGLRLGRHIDGFVDAYYGPPELAERVEAEEVVAPAQLAAAAARLLDSVEPDSWLHRQLVGLETVARRLAGEHIAYEDEVERCYGVRPQWTSEDEFEAVHAELEAVLPGAGSLAERYQSWREGDVVSVEILSRVVNDLLEALRLRTRAAFGLPEGEAVELDEVADEPWAAFNYYLGGLRSRIVLNTDTAMSPDFVAELAAHEGYPGHHTEHAWKEQLLVRERGDLAESIFLVGTPQALISEGIAGVGQEVLLGAEEEDLIAEHVRPAGVQYDPEVSRAVKRARQPLVRVSGNVALLIHARGASENEGREYLMRWALASERRATQSVRFITDRTWRAYVTTYAEGYRLCRDYVDGDRDRFKRLLTEQLSPTDLL